MIGNSYQRAGFGTIGNMIAAMMTPVSQIPKKNFNIIERSRPLFNPGISVRFPKILKFRLYNKIAAQPAQSPGEAIHSTQNRRVSTTRHS